MEDIPADVLTPINDYIGPCTLNLSRKSISVKIHGTHQLGLWPYDSIRRFYSQDLDFFMFTSGRRGPFGVADYKFRINEHDLLSVQRILTQYTGAKFDPPRSNRTNSESSLSSTHSNGSGSSRSYTLREPTNHQQSPYAAHQPGYSTLTTFSSESDLASSPLQPANNSGSPKVSKRSTKKGLTPSRDSENRPLSRQDSSSPINFLEPSNAPTTPTFNKSSRATLPPRTPTTPKSPRSVTLPSTPNTPKNYHKYEDAEIFESGGYDKLKSAREEAQSILNDMTPLENVEKRIKSPPPRSERGSPNSPPLSEKEITHIKHFNREPLINTSVTVHSRRKAEYIDIDLPDSASESSDSQRDSLYDIPTSRPLSQASDTGTSRASTYDVPRPPLPPRGIYDTPRPTIRDSVSPMTRALPHLPTDYVNVREKEAGNGEGNFVMDDLYSEIPSASSIQPKPIPTQQYVPEISPALPGQKLAQELAEEEGYILVNPAALPALVSPPLRPPASHPLPIGNDDDDDLLVDDEYIEIRRNGPDILVGGQDVLTVPVTSEQLHDGPNSEGDVDRLHTTSALTVQSEATHEYVNVPNRSRRSSDGYEEVSELRFCALSSAAKTCDSVDFQGLRLSSSEMATTRSRHSSTSTSVTAAAQSEPTAFCSNVEEMTDLVREVSSPLPEKMSTTPDESLEEMTDVVLESPNSLPQELSTSTPELLSNSLPSDQLSEQHCPQTGSESTDSCPRKVEFDGPPEEVCMPPPLDTHSVVENVSRLNPSEVRPDSIHVPQAKNLVPTAQGSPDANSHHMLLLRKRSLTIGDPLDSKESSKKHTYVNVPDDRLPLGAVPSRSNSELSPGITKKPMPLPRPQIKLSFINGKVFQQQCSNDTALALNTNANNSTFHSSGAKKVRDLIRQFSD